MATVTSSELVEIQFGKCFKIAEQLGKNGPSQEQSNYKAYGHDQFEPTKETMFEDISQRFDAIIEALSKEIKDIQNCGPRPINISKFNKKKSTEEVRHKRRGGRQQTLKHLVKLYSDLLNLPSLMQDEREQCNDEYRQAKAALNKIKRSKNTKNYLQLAAELAKTLLERNKELESTLKHHHNVVEDQAQEIEYLQKQTTALREVNDSRLRIYEQLEVSIQDLERANHRLAVENASDKKHIKTLCHNIETLEARNEELCKSLEDTRKSLETQRRKNERYLQEKTRQAESVKVKHSDTFDETFNETGKDFVKSNSSENSSYAFQAKKSGSNANSTAGGGPLEANFAVSNVANDENEEMLRLMSEMEALKKALLAEQERVSELEEQHAAIIQENKMLQNKVSQTMGTNEEMKSVHEELSILEEVRQGTMCSRCLRSVDDRNVPDDSLNTGIDDDDDRSLMDMLNGVHAPSTFKSAVTIEINSTPNSSDVNMQESNPYRELVEKYEALLEVQRHSTLRINRSNAPISLQEDFQTPGEFSSINIKDISDEIGKPEGNVDDINNHSKIRPIKNCIRISANYCETETSSSGFADEISNKATQTEERQGYFLCTIGDGEDCKFSIYGDASPIESRFRNRPEYRELFKEIFAVLKRAAENKEDGENLPLLDDTHPAPNKVPPVTPATEDLPDFGEDTQSIVSSAVSEQSVAMSECITKTERKTAKKHINEKSQEKNPLLAQSGTILSPGFPLKQIIEDGRILTPLKREPLEYLAVTAQKKKNRKKNRSFAVDRSNSPVVPTPPKIYNSSGKKRRDMRQFNIQLNNAGSTPSEWNGNSMVIYSRNIESPSSTSGLSSKKCEIDVSGLGYKPSTASQDLHKLKNLDLSYAEVLRRADTCNHHRRK